MEDSRLLDAANTTDIEQYLLEQAVIRDDGRPIAVERAGAGNMNLALRVRTAAGASFIVKQGRPWVEKYPQIAAPFGRTLVEAAFYGAVSNWPAVASMMPKLLHVDGRNHIIVLEDLGAAADCTFIYRGAPLPLSSVTLLLRWLAALSQVVVAGERRETFANRAMRALNHQHIFDVPLRADNGLDLDAITPGLLDAARALSGDREYCRAVATLGERYLADGTTLVHGDYFPGSWLQAAGTVRVIDPEFCFLGDPEFDCGVMAAHLAIGGDSGKDALDALAQSVSARSLDPALVAGYMGVEIMRRLIGVAQLPLSAGIDRKRWLLARSRRLLLEPAEGLS